MLARSFAILGPTLGAALILGAVGTAASQGQGGARGGAVGGYHPSGAYRPSVPVFPRNLPAPSVTPGSVNAYRPNSGYIPFVGYYLPGATAQKQPSPSGLGFFGEESLVDQLSGRPAPPPLVGPVPQQKAAAASVKVRIPAGADLWFGDTKVPVTGAVGEFKTPVLQPGRLYEYEVRARWKQNGREVTQTQQVVVTSGAAARVDFTPSPGNAP
jgi:uncharacterized protein (TIGR03000 family)